VFSISTHRTLLLFYLFIMILLTGCASEDKHEHSDGISVHASGDIREAAENKSELPTFLKSFGPEINAVYAAVPDHADMLKHIPCYCGCGESVGHSSSLDCFVHDIQADGPLTWDSHGTTCNVCLHIAAESIKLRVSDGKTTKEIRDYIDKKYQKGFAEPTPTPYPAES
jgi:hypothetical protein